MENERNVEKVTDCNKLATPIEEKKTPEELYEQLIETIHRYHPSDDVSMIEKAYHIADKAHGGQKRKSGDPYIIHPLHVAIILAELEMDKETIVAGLLHDVVEDTVMTDEEIKEYLAGNLCRCSGYEGQLRGIRAYLDWKKQREEDAQ